MVASHVPPTGDMAHSPDWESNQTPFGLQAGALSTEPHQPGLRGSFLSLGLPVYAHTRVCEWFIQHLPNPHAVPQNEYPLFQKHNPQIIIFKALM